MGIRGRGPDVKLDVSGCVWDDVFEGFGTLFGFLGRVVRDVSGRDAPTPFYTFSLG